MSKDVLGTVYTMILDDPDYRASIAGDPAVLEEWELTAAERQVLIEEATMESQGLAIGAVLRSLQTGPPLSPEVASTLGVALNRASGLPTEALHGPGFAEAAGCCPWNKGPVGPPARPPRDDPRIPGRHQL